MIDRYWLSELALLSLAALSFSPSFSHFFTDLYKVRGCQDRPVSSPLYLNQSWTRVGPTSKGHHSLLLVLFCPQMAITAMAQIDPLPHCFSRSSTPTATAAVVCNCKLAMTMVRWAEERRQKGKWEERKTKSDWIIAITAADDNSGVYQTGRRRRMGGGVGRKCKFTPTSSTGWRN